MSLSRRWRRLISKRFRAESLGTPAYSESFYLRSKTLSITPPKRLAVYITLEALLGSPDASEYPCMTPIKFLWLASMRSYGTGFFPCIPNSKGFCGFSPILSYGV